MSDLYVCPWCHSVHPDEVVFYGALKVHACPKMPEQRIAMVGENQVMVPLDPWPASDTANSKTAST